MSKLKDRAMLAAEAYMRHRNCEILDVAYPTGEGEQIDIVAEDGDAIVFVDIKARKDASKGFPSEDVSKSTRERREMAAIQWLEDNGSNYTDRPVRFDNISLLVLGPGRAFVKHFVNAMNPNLDTPALCEPEPESERELACATA